MHYQINKLSRRHGWWRDDLMYSEDVELVIDNPGRLLVFEHPRSRQDTGGGWDVHPSTGFSAASGRDRFLCAREILGRRRKIPQATPGKPQRRGRMSCKWEVVPQTSPEKRNSFHQREGLGPSGNLSNS